MLLTPGQRLSSYEIVTLRGKGGMGEVYCARDPELDRDVAIKVLPAEFANDAERLLRFRREAKLLAALQHPRIAAIHGFETVDTGGGPLYFLVLEYVEGASLAERLQNGPLQVDEALELGVQVAEGLEAAHDKGIVHRDLKPANVMVDPHGTAKVLDFGLARAAADEPSTAAADADSPTITADYTMPGVVLGTAAYMSPEQARGRTVDRRTDVWSFGCVLYECLTGRKPFRGESATETMGAILHQEPDWSLLPPGIPPTVRLLLRRCLTKDKDRRLHAIADARIELQEAIADPASSSLGLASATPDAGRGAGRRARTIGAMVLVAAVTAGVLALLRPALPESVVQRYSIVLPQGLRLGNGKPRTMRRGYFDRPFDVSSDGHVLVVVASKDGGEQQLYVRDAGDSAFRPLEGTAGAWDPAVSDDGEWVVFSANGVVKQVAVHGGAAVRLLDHEPSPAFDWGGNQWIYFALGGTQVEVRRVPVGGGTDELVGSGEGIWAAPKVLPGGTVLLTRVRWLDRDEQIAALRPGASAVEPLVQGCAPCWSPTGHLLFARQGTLMAAGFDPEKLTLGPAVPLLEGVTTTTCGAAYTMTASGTVYHIAGARYRRDTDKALVRVGMDGTVTPFAVRVRPYIQCRMEPHGRRIAVTTEMRSEGAAAGGRQGVALSILDPERDVLTVLTSHPGSIYLGPWSPRGEWIYYALLTSTGYVACRVRADGSGTPEPIPGGKGLFPTSITRDGSRLFAVRRDIIADVGDIVSLRIDEGFRVEEMAIGRARKPAVSPDGKWLACVEGPKGGQVFLVAVDGHGGRVQVSRDGGSDPQWSHDGTRLYYRSNQVPMVVDVTLPDSADSGGAPKVSAPTVAVETPDGVRADTLMPDGKGFLGYRVEDGHAGADQDRPDEIIVTLHFDKEIERLVPRR